MNFADDVLIGQMAYINTGTGIGQERRITDNTQSSGTIQVPTWTAPDTTSQYELHNTWTVDDYNTAVNQAVSDLRGDNGALIEQVADVSLTLTADGTSSSYFYNLPTGLKWIYGIWYESGTSGVYDYQLTPRSWRLEKLALASSSASSTHQVVLDRGYWQPISGRKLRIVGAGYQAELATDTATLSEHLLTFVLHQAAFYLLDPLTTTGTPDAETNEKRAVRHFQMAQAQRGGLLEHRVRPGAVQVPV